MMVVRGLGDIDKDRKAQMTGASRKDRQEHSAKVRGDV